MIYLELYWLETVYLIAPTRDDNFSFSHLTTNHNEIKKRDVKILITSINNVFINKHSETYCQVGNLKISFNSFPQL